MNYFVQIVSFYFFDEVLNYNFTDTSWQSYYYFVTYEIAYKHWLAEHLLITPIH